MNLPDPVTINHSYIIPEDLIPVVERIPEYMNGYQVTLNEPEIWNNNSGYPIWRVLNPGGERNYHSPHFWFWSPSHQLPFQLIENLGDGYWSIRFDSSGSVDEPDVEYSGWYINEPFEYNNRFYVVMDEDTLNYADVDSDGSGPWFYSEDHRRDFRIGSRVRSDLFGENAFRCYWREEAARDDGFSVETEAIDVSDDIAPLIAANNGREVPLVSFEQEFSGNGELVAQKLNQAGLSYYPFVEAYHNSEARFNRDDLNGGPICYLETDSSCGYEIIFSKINLRNRAEAEKVSEAQRILRELKNENKIRLSARCGFHVHVDVSSWAMKDVVSAYHLWNYMEDTIFRFASAFWNSHRDEETGHDYSTPVRKGYTTRTEIGRTLAQRRDALNFMPFLAARGRCDCDALIYEDWENCTCNLSQPTIEFRVFNATTNQRKIRAYLAFCVAFVNMSKTHQHSPEFFPEMRFSGTNIKETQANGKSWEEASLERIRYILEFPLTNVEKSDILYCLRNSSLEPVVELL